jgi:1-phosphatidylinositol phosphodiesterase
MTGRNTALFLIVSAFLLFNACDTISSDSITPTGMLDPAQSLVTGASSPAISAWNWMQSQTDATLLSEISIPGSHDSGALYEPVAGTAKCQNLIITDQLNNGIRFLDIRCRHIDNAFAIHHGSIYQHLNFDDVLNACFAFLAAHPTETILMSVKEEYDSSNVTRSFEATFMAYVAKKPGGWYLGSSIPALGSVRGKIVLLRRFSASAMPLGIPATDWADNASFSSGALRVQDCYKVTDTGSKWNSLVALFNEALAGPSTTLYLNFSSGYKPLIFGIPSITTVSNYINPKIVDYFRASAGGRLGVIVMDFADTYRSGLIIAANGIPGSGVVFYRDINYGGSSGRPLAKGRYTLSQLQAAGVPNDWASSCKIPVGWKVTVYQHDNFGGTSWTLYADPAGGQCNFPGYSGLNDVMSSCVIE